jgi:tetratricopeptide (TPR) repeat protein
MPVRLVVPLLTWLATCAAAGAASGPPRARTETVRLEPLSSRALYQQTLRGTVHISVSRNGKVTPAGTGFVVDAEARLVVTNHHVVPEGGVCFVTFPQYHKGRVIADPSRYRFDKGVPGTVLDSDPQIDLAVIRLASLPTGVTALKLAAESPQPGDRLHLVGNPSASRGLWVYTTGLVRQLVKRSMPYGPRQYLDARVVEAQMDTNYGDSGSPVVNDSGELVGVHSGSSKEAYIRGFAWHIDVEELKLFLGDVRALQGPSSAAAEVYERLALRLIRKEKRTEALAELNRAIERDGKRASAYRHRARLHFLANNHDAALADGYRALDITPNDVQALNDRGIVFATRGDHTRALADYSRAIALEPRDAVFRFNRGVAHVRKKRYEQAIADFSEAIRLNPGYVRAWAERAEAHDDRKDYPRAIADYQEAIKRAPGDALLHARLGHIYRNSGSDALAAQSYEKALKMGLARPAVVWRSLGHSRFTLKRYEQAVQAYSEALKHDPRDAHAWFWRGAVREEQGELDLAQADYARGVELHRPYAGRLKSYTTRHIRVSNATREPIKVYARFQVRLGERWQELPAGDWLFWNLAPGETIRLAHARSGTIQARQVRIWAVGLKTGTRWENTRKSPLLLVEAPYQARQRDTHEHRFGQ